MILPLVTEVLARVGRHPSAEQAWDRLRRSALAPRSGGAQQRGERARASLAGLTPPARALVIACAACELDRPLIVLVDSNQRAEELADPLRYFFRAVARKPARHVAMLPALDVLPYEARSPHAEIAETRAAALWRFATGEADLLIVPVASALLRLREKENYKSLARSIARDQEIPHEELLTFLTEAGYERHEMVEMPGQFAVRGGILDVHSPEAARPVRIELLGDTVESLREFDPETQRSTRPLERVTLLPLAELPRNLSWLRDASRAPASLGEEAVPIGFSPGWEFSPLLVETWRSNLFDFRSDAVIVEDEPEIIAEATAAFREKLAQSFEQVDAAEVLPPDAYYLSMQEWREALERQPRLQLQQLALEGSDPPPLELSTQPTARYHGNIVAFMAEAKARLAAGAHVLISAANTGEMERLADLCREYEMPYQLGEREEGATVSRLAEEASGGVTPTGRGAAVLAKVPVEHGFAIPDVRLVLFGYADLFETLPAAAGPRHVGPSLAPLSRRAEEREVRPKSAAFFSNFSDLKPGDYVVHVDHGIGRFEGLRQVSVDGADGDFMFLRYAEDAKLYVPLARLDLVQKYQSLGGAAPQLDRLGSGAWEARKSRVRKSASELAEKLLALYADRKAGGGFAFSPDSHWQREFEDAFEFQETPDQVKAIEDVKRDMERAVPMDRLLCGDVGYGKTEVAMRAALKAVMDSKQIALLAPTTVLAFQHYETFRQRFGAFPVRIEMLSRFRSAREQKKVLQDLEAGRVDMIIGTHRLLSKDVRFQDLGLLVVDEEQRFGVAHKERIKELRKDVDVLTMSATPIPRTLQMSLAGLRDMSLIETPPKDRLAIQTTVAPLQEALIRRAIEEELARGGQVFFVHNRVESIHSLAALVKKLVPAARVVVAHGQMKEAELEKVMMKFVRHEADALVATTIIENGLDIPRANTILINRADRLGLAELYQLRGRVGRSNQRAYAYLLVPPEKSLSPLARQRLAALREFSELGAGFRIAALDLELRGAGNVLGKEQHGHIEAVGFDLYCQMLERAVAERKGKAARPERRTTLNIGAHIRIPSDYIESENLRLRIYKRIAGISTEAEREEVRRELHDRFGPPPPDVERLLEFAMLKSLAERLLVASIERKGQQVAIRFYDDTPVPPEKLVRVIRGRRGLRLDPGGILWLERREAGEEPLRSARNVLLQLQS